MLGQDMRGAPPSRREDRQDKRCERLRRLGGELRLEPSLRLCARAVLGRHMVEDVDEAGAVVGTKGRRLSGVALNGREELVVIARQRLGVALGIGGLKPGGRAKDMADAQPLGKQPCKRPANSTACGAM